MDKQIVDWEPLNSEDGVHVAEVPDELQISAFSAGEADALTGWPFCHPAYPLS